MMNVFWGMSQSGGESIQRTTQASIEARDATSKARQAQSAAEDLERRIDKLTLINMALWSLLSEKTGATEEQLIERVKTIDLMDGVADGKLKRQVAKCAACGRVMASRHTKCLYCGAEKLQITAFDDVI